MLSKTIPRYLTMRLSKPAYMKIPMLNLFNLKILGLYSIVLSTRGKVCVKVGGKIGHLFPRLREWILLMRHRRCAKSLGLNIEAAAGEFTKANKVDSKGIYLPRG